MHALPISEPCSSTLARTLMPNAEAELNRQLETCVKLALGNQHYPGLRAIEVSATNTTVTLQGEVSTFHERQLALSLCRRVPGVRELIDLLVVAHQPIRITV
jgi:osmotically-inducible protein OsmY